MRKEDLPALGAALQMGLTQSIILASLPVLVAVTEVSYARWSLAIGGTLFVYMLAAPLWGRAIDRGGPGKIQVLTAMGTVLSNALLVAALFVPHPEWAFALILVSRIGYAGFASGQYPSSQATVMAGARPGRVQSALGGLIAANHGARLAGPALVGLFAAVRFQLPLVVLLLLGIVLVWGTWRTYRGAGTGDVAPAVAGGPATSVPTMPAPRWSTLRRIWPALVIGFVVTFSVAHMQFALSLSLADQFGLDPAGASGLLSQALMVAAAMMVVTHLGVIRAVAGRPLVQTVVLAVGVLGGSSLLLGDFSRLGLFAAMALLAVGHGLSSPAYTAWARERRPEASGTVAASIMSIHTLGHGIGILSAGTLGAAAPWPLFAPVMVGAVVQTALITALLMGRRQTGPTEGPLTEDQGIPVADRF